MLLQDGKLYQLSIEFYWDFNFSGLFIAFYVILCLKYLHEDSITANQVTTLISVRLVHTIPLSVDEQGIAISIQMIANLEVDFVEFGKTVIR